MARAAGGTAAGEASAGEAADATAAGTAEPTDGEAEGSVHGPRHLTIVNRKGLHARASARFVETVQSFDAAVLVEKDGEEVPGTDLLGLLMLAGTQGSSIAVSATGKEAVRALDALEALVTDGFGEDDGAHAA